MWILWIFSPILCCPFLFLMMTFKEQEFLILIKFIFFLYGLYFCNLSNKPLLNLIQENFARLHRFSPRTFSMFSSYELEFKVKPCFCCVSSLISDLLTIWIIKLGCLLWFSHWKAQGKSQVCHLDETGLWYTPCILTFILLSALGYKYIKTDKEK